MTRLELIDTRKSLGPRYTQAYFARLCQYCTSHYKHLESGRKPITARFETRLKDIYAQERKKVEARLREKERKSVKTP